MSWDTRLFLYPGTRQTAGLPFGDIIFQTPEGEVHIKNVRRYDSSVIGLGLNLIGTASAVPTSQGNYYFNTHSLKKILIEELGVSLQELEKADMSVLTPQKIHDLCKGKFT